MALPDMPATFRAPTAAELPWYWRVVDAAGQAVAELSDLVEMRFASQGDAESWLGETYADLVAAGASAASLYELDTLVYGPMSLES